MVAYTGGSEGGEGTQHHVAASVLSPPPLLRPAVLEQDRAEPAGEPDNTLFRTLINIQVIFKKQRDRINIPSSSVLLETF